MSDDDVVELFPVQEILVDSFVRHKRRSHLMTCVGYRWIDGRKVIVARLAWPAENTDAAIEEANHAMNNPETSAVASVAVNPRKRRVH